MAHTKVLALPDEFRFFPEPFARIILPAIFASLIFEKGVYYNRKSAMRICFDPYE
jgi:hypothetical protein